MNTATVTYAPILEQTGDNVILLEDLEFGMPREQLEEITDLYNNGWDFQDIAKEVKRNRYEVLLALIHQVKSGRHMRPLAFRKENRPPSTLLVPGKEQTC